MTASEIKTNETTEMDYSITPSEMLEMIQLANKGYQAWMSENDT